MTSPTEQLLTLRSSILLDLDDAGRTLVAHDETGSMQLYEIAADGTRRQLTDFGEPATGRYLPGAEPRLLVVSADVGGSERTQLWLLDLDNPDAAPEPMVTDPDFIHTLLDVAEDSVIYATNRRDGVEFDIIARTVSTGEEQVLYDGGGHFDEVVVSPDRAWIIASRLTLIAASSQLLLIDGTTGEVKEITDPAVPGEWFHVHWLPGSINAVASSDHGGERFDVRRYDLAANSWETLAADPDADLAAVPSPSGTDWVVLRTSDGRDTMTVHDWDGASLTATDTVLELPNAGVAWYMTRLTWSPSGGRFGFTFTSPAGPAEAYSWSAAEQTRRLTISNSADVLPTLPVPESHRVPAPDGEQIPVFVMRPPAGVEADGSAILYIHGGPEGASMLTWNPIATALAMSGHTVVVPNVRGSSNYGRRWVSLDDIEKRLDSVADLAAIHAWLPSIGVDQGRVALYGGSYGGYMVLAGLTFHAGLWAAGVDIVGISSLVSFIENTSAYRRAYREREYGSLAEHRDILQAASPLPIIDRLRVPLFIIHGRNDPRVPLSEAEQVAAAVRGNGAECQMLIYDDEGHGLAKRKNRIDAYPKAADFLARHLAP